MEIDIMLGGLGGQGIRVASQILAQAAGWDGKQAYQNNIFGGGVRGGAINATVVIADDEVLSPVLDEPWGAIAMDQHHSDWFGEILSPAGIMVVNTTMASELPQRSDISLLEVPSTDLADKEFGKRVLATMIALGAFVEASGVVRVSSIREAVSDILPPHRRGNIEASVKALQLGADYAKPIIEARREFNLAQRG